MLLEFSVCNFMSFNNRVILSMIPTSGKELPNTQARIFLASKSKKPLVVNKIAAIYGANASGKSNILMALQTARDFIVRSANIDDGAKDKKLPFVPFKLDASMQDTPSKFELCFFLDGYLYRYGFEADELSVKSEWLYQKLSLSGKERVIICRDSNGISYDINKSIEIAVKDTGLILSWASLVGDELCKKIVSYIKKFKAYSPVYGQDHVATLLEITNEISVEAISDLLQFADVGVSGFKFKEIPIDEMKKELSKIDFNDKSEKKTQDVFGEFAVKTILKLIDMKALPTHDIVLTHHTYANGSRSESIDFSVGMESMGTLRFISLVAQLIRIAKDGGLLIADEFDTSLHPILAAGIVKIFTLLSGNKSQIIFTTHNTNLFNETILRRDQVWIMEKNKFGCSDLFCVSDYKPRNDAVLSKKYLEGRFGGVPNLHDGYLERACEKISNNNS